MFTIDQIECFQAVSEEGSLTAAAGKLRRAKSAVSYNLENLEEQLGFALLDRRGYRLTLTDRGKQFLEKVKEFRQQVEQLNAYAVQLGDNVETKLRISSTAIYPLTKLSAALKKAISVFPSTEIIFHREVLSGAKMLANDVVDFAVIEKFTTQTNLQYKLIEKVDLPLVISCNHPFLTLSTKHQTLTTLRTYPQIIIRSTIEDEFIKQGVDDYASSWSVSDLATKKELIKLGLGWGRLPLHEIEEDLNEGSLFHLRHLKRDDSMDICVAYKKDKAIGKVAKFLWDFF